MNVTIDSAIAMPDVQSRADARHVPIQRVGVRRVRQPMLVADAQGKANPTVAEFELTVALAAESKGTHMSRFLALLENYRNQALTPVLFCEMLEEMLPLLDAERGDITAKFPYFINKTAPVSGVQSLMDYELTWVVRSTDNAQAGDTPLEFELTVLVPVTSLCPCSKEISDYGAHNQRSHIIVTAVYSDPQQVDVEALIQLIEKQASSELWGLLKRTDEKYVTEYAYDNPKFVEDLVRDVAVNVKSVEGLTRYTVSAENFESIHNHSAYAVVEGEGLL